MGAPTHHAHTDEVEPAHGSLFADRVRGTRLVRLAELRRRVCLGRSTIYRRISDGTFPPPKSLGGRAVAWLESDIEDWIAGLTTRTDAGR